MIRFHKYLIVPGTNVNEFVQSPLWRWVLPWLSTNRDSCCTKHGCRDPDFGISPQPQERLYTRGCTRAGKAQNKPPVELPARGTGLAPHPRDWPHIWGMLRVQRCDLSGLILLLTSSE